MSHILIINGHPNLDSFNHAIHKAYKEGAQFAGHHIKEITLANLTYSPNLQYGYSQKTELEPDLLDAWQNIQQANHIVWIYPIWWGGMPALLKGFVDRVFLPGYAFKYQTKSPFPEQLLKGKTAEIITTMDTPVWYYKLIYRNTGIHQLKKGILEFCGIKNKRVTYLAPVKTSTPEKRQQWLSHIRQLGTAITT